MCKASVFKDRPKWRVRLTDTQTRRTVNYIYDTEEQARAAMPELIRQYRRPVGVPLCKALEAYREHLATRGNRAGQPNRARSIDTTLGRLEKLFDPDRSVITGELTPARVKALWEPRAAGLSVDTNRNTLSQVKTFIAWMAAKGWMKALNLLDGIEVLGMRRKGKPQLTEDEARQFFRYAQKCEKDGDRSAIAAPTALLLGMRASEVTDRIVRDLDAGGTKLRITKAKTPAGIRVLLIPKVLRPLLQNLARGKQPGDRLFGKATRFWLRDNVRRLSELAGVPVVSPHGLRGTHATIARAVGVAPEAVAACLGHESPETTDRHYARKDAVDQAQVNQVTETLTGQEPTEEAP